LVPVVCWFVVAMELAAWVLMRLGDEAVIPTLVAYGPRWIWLVPPMALIPIAFWRRSVLPPLAFAVIICLAGVMQFELPRLGQRDGCCRITVVTLNAHDFVRPGTLGPFAESARADILALQEWDESLMPELSGWPIQCAGGLCVASRYPMTPIKVLDRRTIGGYHAMAIATEVSTPRTPVSFFSVHLETVRKGVEPMLRSHLRETADLRSNLFFRSLESRVVEAWIREHSDGPVIVAGDFNLPTDSAIYRRVWGRWSDAFDSVGFGLGHTKFTSWWGVRIDHVLFDDRWEAVSSLVGPDIGSDHRPVVATLERTP
jgi:vancomycin resistance protein VanJ